MVDKMAEILPQNGKVLRGFFWKSTSGLAYVKGYDEEEAA
jgi:hypothetical protein